MWSPAIDASYDGPHLQDSQVTVDFVNGLTAAYKEQKKLPKKYVCQVDLVKLVLPCLCCILNHEKQMFVSLTINFVLNQK